MKTLDLFLTKNQLWQYRHKLIWADKLSQKTIKRKLASLKKFCQWAVEKGWLARNPFEEREDRPRSIRQIGLIGQIGVILGGLIIGLVILRVSLARLPSPPEVPKSTSLPETLTETSGFGKTLGEFSQPEGFGELGQLNTIESTVLVKLAKEGKLILPESLGIETEEITIKTIDGYDGNITINPDGQGVLNLLFEGQSPKKTTVLGGFVNIQNANLKEGNLIYAGVANQNQNYNFLQFRGGLDLAERFTVSAAGNISASGNLKIDGGQITSNRNLVFSPQDQPTLILAPKTSRLASNLAIEGMIYDGGLGIFGTTGQRLSQTFNFTRQLTIEFEFLTGKSDLNIDFNINPAGNKFYRATWQTNGKFTLQTCDPNCSTLGSVANYPFEPNTWHHGYLHIDNSWLTWELDYSVQKISVPVQISDLPLLTSGYLRFSQSFGAITNLRINESGNTILTSGDARIGGNLEVAGSVRVGELADQSASTHVCYNANGDLAECGADYAEWYPTSLREEITNYKLQITNKADFSEDIAGTLVSITSIPNPADDPAARYLAAPSKKPYDSNILGVLADPNLGANGKKLNETYQPLVLVGRVPVKVSDINGLIEVGEAITSSEIPGVGMRAAKAGYIIGTALEPWPKTSGKSGKSDTQTGSILILINPGWWEPEKEKWAVNSEQLEEPEITDEPKSAEPLLETRNQTTQFNSLIVENLRTTNQAQQAEQLIYQTQQQISTLESQFGQLLTKVEQLQPAAFSSLTIEKLRSTGQAEVAAQLIAQSLGEPEEIEEVVGEEGQEGTELELSDTSQLLANVQDFIKDLQQTQLSSLTPVADLNISKDIEIYEEIGKGEVGNEKKQDAYPHFSLPDSFLASYSSFPHLTVLGSTSLGQTTIAGNLLVDSSIQLGTNSINSLNNTLYLQSYGFGGLDILSGKITIDKTGNLTVAESVAIEKDLTVKRSLFANLIKPLDEVITIEGNLKTTGSGTFDKIIIASAKTGDRSIAETNNVELLAPNSSLPTPDSQIFTNATAGTAILLAGQTQLSITNQSVTIDSLVYLTPISTTGNKVLFVKAKKATSCIENNLGIGGPSLTPTPIPIYTDCLLQPGYFIVAIDKPINKDIEFNWWVIN